MRGEEVEKEVEVEEEGGVVGIGDRYRESSV